MLTLKATRVLLIAALLIVTAACSGSTFATNDQMREALAAAGLECVDYEQAEFIESGDVGFCQIDGETLRLTIFADEQAQDRARELDDTFNGRPLLYGDRWMVVLQTRQLAERVQDVLGGEIA